MATVRKRVGKRGRISYEVQIRLKDSGGQTTKLNGTFRTKTLANDWKTTKEAEIKEGRYRNTKAASQALMVDLCDKYEEFVVPTHEKSSHVPDKARLRTLRRFFAEKNLTLGGTTTQHVLEFVDIRQKAVSDDAIRRELQLWADIVDSAMTLWNLYVLANPVATAKRILKKLRKLKPGNRRARRLRPGEYETIRDSRHVRTTLIRQVAMFAIETAMREGEIGNSRREYVNREKRVIYVPKSKMDWLTGNKGKVVPLSPTALKILDSLPVSFIDGSLFGMNAEQIKKGFARLCKNEKLEDLRFHDLCHESTSRLFEMGYSIPEVSAITGKKDWRTLERYTHPDPEKLAKRMR